MAPAGAVDAALKNRKLVPLSPDSLVRLTKIFSENSNGDPVEFTGVRHLSSGNNNPQHLQNHPCPQQHGGFRWNPSP